MVLQAKFTPNGWILHARGVLGQFVQFQVLRPVVPTNSRELVSLESVLEGWLFDDNRISQDYLEQLDPEHLVITDPESVIRETQYAGDYQSLLVVYDRLLRRHCSRESVPATEDQLEEQIERFLSQLDDGINTHLAIRYS